MDKGNKGMKDIEEIQESALLTFISFIPAFPVTRFYLSTYLRGCLGFGVCLSKAGFLGSGKQILGGIPRYFEQNWRSQVPKR